MMTALYHELDFHWTNLDGKQKKRGRWWWGGGSRRGKDRRGEGAYETGVFVAWRWHFDINLAGSRKTAPPAHRKYENTARREGGRGEDEGMGEVISSEMCCDGNKQAGAMMETADNERGENMYEKPSNGLPTKKQIKNRCQVNRAEIKTRQKRQKHPGSSAQQDSLAPPCARFVSHLLGPEPISWFSLLPMKQMGGWGGERKWRTRRKAYTARSAQAGEHMLLY